MQVTVVKGQFQYRDADGVVHEVEALRGPDGKSAYQYARESGLIDSSTTEEDFTRACGQVYEELDKIQAARLSIQNLADIRDRALAATNAAAAVTSEAIVAKNLTEVATSVAMNAAAYASEQGNYAQSCGSNMLGAYQSALSALDEMSIWNNAVANLTTINDLTKQPEVFIYNEYYQPDGYDTSVGYERRKNFDFRLPFPQNAVQATELGLSIQTGVHHIDTTPSAMDPAAGIKASSFSSSFDFTRAFQETPFAFYMLTNTSSIHSVSFSSAAYSTARLYGTASSNGMVSYVNTSPVGCSFSVNKGANNYYFEGDVQWVAFGRLASQASA